RFADYAPVQPFVTLTQALDHGFGAVMGWALFIAGDQKGDAALVVRVLGDKALNGNDHRRQAAFHVRRATAAEHALFINQGVEWLMLPALHWAGGHHIGMPGKAQHGTVVATVAGPE